MSDRDVDDLISAIEQFGERQDRTGLDQRVTDFAEMTPDKIGLALQKIAERMHPEFHPHQLAPARRRDEALRRALDILTTSERRFQPGLRQYDAPTLQQPPQPWSDQSDTPLALSVSEEQGQPTAASGDTPPTDQPKEIRVTQGDALTVGAQRTRAAVEPGPGAPRQQDLSAALPGVAALGAAGSFSAEATVR